MDTDYVFTAENGEPLHADHLAQRFERLVAAAGLPAIRYHDLWHTHATLLQPGGVAADATFDRWRERDVAGIRGSARFAGAA